MIKANTDLVRVDYFFNDLMFGSKKARIDAAQANAYFNEIYPFARVEELLEVFRVTPSTAFSGKIDIFHDKSIKLGGDLVDVNEGNKNYKLVVFFEQNLIEINYLHATELEKRLGHGKALFEGLRSYAENVGIEKIELTAAFTEGGYFWAKQGLRPATPRDYEELWSFAFKKFYAAKRALTNRYGCDDVDRVHLSIGKIDVEPDGLRKLAANKMELPNGEPIGRRLLAGSKWNAVYHIKPAA